MLKTLLAYAETPETVANISELKVISTATDLSAQIAAMEDTINQGYDAVIANAIATHGTFDGFAVHAGSTGALRAMLDAGHQLVPIAAEAENGFLKMAAELKAQGLEVVSVRYFSALGAIAVKAAVAPLKARLFRS